MHKLCRGYQNNTIAQAGKAKQYKAIIHGNKKAIHGNKNSKSLHDGQPGLCKLSQRSDGRSSPQKSIHTCRSWVDGGQKVPSAPAHSLPGAQMLGDKWDVKPWCQKVKFLLDNFEDFDAAKRRCYGVFRFNNGPKGAQEYKYPEHGRNWALKAVYGRHFLILWRPKRCCGLSIRRHFDDHV